jgi:putative copper export protein
VEPIDLASVAVRSAAFIAVLQAAGLAWFAVGCCRDDADRSRVRRWSRVCAVCAIVLVVAHRGMDAGRLAGDWEGIYDSKLQALVWRRAPGESTLTCALGLAIVALGPPRIAAFGAGVIVASFALTGHTTSAAHAHLLQVLLVGHVGLIAFWFGGVSGLLRVRDLAYAVARFSRCAIWLVPWILVLGLLLIWGLMPDLSAFRTTYGELLIVKIIGFACVLGLAAINRLRFVPGISRGDTAAARRLRRIVLVEAVLLAAVLVVTAIMTALFSCH